MAKVRTEIELDEDVLRDALAVAERSGRTRDQVIEDAVRRQLTAASLDEILERVRSRIQLSDDEVLRIALQEQVAYRAEQRSIPPST